MYKQLLLPALQVMGAEQAHHLALVALQIAQSRPIALKALAGRHRVEDPRLEVEALGLRFPNPIGVAAGFDKNAVAARALSALGFGHLEVGTVTPLAQPGKPRPRLFRLSQDAGLINRLGFPNEGMASIGKRLQGLRKPDFVLGVNIGPNAASVAAGREVDDYVACFRQLQAYADYIAVNVSSPNTAGLRNLQAKQALGGLLAALDEAAAAVRSTRPLLLKLSPDLTYAELGDALEVVSAHRVAGVIACNTTVERPAGLTSAAKVEAGGLSGAPLRARSTDMIRTIASLTAGKLPIIGVGGIVTVEDVIDKLAAGAALVQLYTGMIFEGPSIAGKINRGLLRYLERHGLKSVQEIIGTRRGSAS
ncbi:MAG: quinone-dependent dihydroorotate dehydrogenase [Chloroflexota bacterium]|nr:quinone-dependent dihydroorotate dehydrogenase [Chloroflexota bacterium]